MSGVLDVRLLFLALGCNSESTILEIRFVGPLLPETACRLEVYVSWPACKILVFLVGFGLS